MILYCDTSALVKFYYAENHSEAMLARRREADAIAISVVGFAEFLSAANRKRREGNLTEETHQRAVELFDNDWPSLIRVDVTPELNPITARLLSAHPLRGFDAIHLASALLLTQRLQTREIRFSTYDQRQWLAASREQLPVFPPLLED